MLQDGRINFEEFCAMMRSGSTQPQGKLLPFHWSSRHKSQRFINRKRFL